MKLLVFESLFESLLKRLSRKIENNLDDILRWEEFMTGDADVAIVCFGGTTRAVQGAIEEARAQGIKVGMFRPITVWPFPEKALEALSKKVKHLVVAEHNYGQILLEVQRIVKDNCSISHIGKVDGTTITPVEIIEHIKEVL